MSASFQMRQTPEGTGGNYGLEAELQAALQALFSQPSLQAILESEKKELIAIKQYAKQYYEALNIERMALLENRVKIAILEKCITENEKTREFLLSAIHLLTVAKKAYQAMRSPWSRTIELRNGPIDIFSENFVDTQINPFVSELGSIAPVGFTEADSVQDEGLQNIMDYAIAQRENAIQRAVETKQCCDQFLQYLASLNKVFAPQAYFKLRINLSTLLRALQSVLEAEHSLVVPLFHKNKRYANHTLPELKAKIKESNIEERLQVNYEHLAQHDKEIAVHETSIQHLKQLIRDQSPPRSLFFSVPKPPFKNESAPDDNSLRANAIHGPKWTRVTLGR